MKDKETTEKYYNSQGLHFSIYDVQTVSIS